MNIPQIDDHVAQARDRLIEQFKGKPNLQALLDTFVGEVQEIEDALFQLLNETSLAAAVGDQLDVIGLIIQQPRNGQLDAAYRNTLAARIQLNLSNGTPENIISLIRAVVGDVEVEFIDGADLTPTEIAHFEAIVNAAVPTIPTAIQAAGFVQSGKPAGVRGIFRTAPDDPFGFFSDPVALGFDTSPITGVGGNFAFGSDS